MVQVERCRIVAGALDGLYAACFLSSLPEGLATFSQPYTQPPVRYPSLRPGVSRSGTWYLGKYPK